MPFSVFPDASNGPLSLGPGQISAPIGFPETAGGAPPAVYLRIIMLGAGCEPPDAPPPTFRLRAGTGNPVDLQEDHPVFIWDRPEATGARVAKAQLFIESEHVYAIRILIDRPGSTWQLRITNNDDAERKFTWVVADNEPESAQPWLNLPQTLSFNGEVGKRIPQSLDVHNLGTGNLTISLGGLVVGSRFQLDLLPADIVPNHCGTLIITFNAPATAGTTEERYTAKNNDKQATESAQHNDRIRLIATTTAATPPDVSITGVQPDIAGRPVLLDFTTSAPIDPVPEGAWQIMVIGLPHPGTSIFSPVSRVMNVGEIPLADQAPPPTQPIEIVRFPGETDGHRSYRAQIAIPAWRVEVKVTAPNGSSADDARIVPLDEAHKDDDKDGKDSSDQAKDAKDAKDDPDAVEKDNKDRKDDKDSKDVPDKTKEDPDKPKEDSKDSKEDTDTKAFKDEEDHPPVPVILKDSELLFKNLETAGLADSAELEPETGWGAEGSYAGPGGSDRAAHGRTFIRGEERPAVGERVVADPPELRDEED
jgi:hypothetical protein